MGLQPSPHDADSTRVRGADPVVPQERVGERGAATRGWKIPETTLTFPWIVRMFPDVRYVFWIRNPRDCVIGRQHHGQPRRLGRWLPAHRRHPALRRAISWKYQYDLVNATPAAPALDRGALRGFRPTPGGNARPAGVLPRHQAGPDSGEPPKRWAGGGPTPAPNYYPFFAPAMERYGYEIPPCGCLTPRLSRGSERPSSFGWSRTHPRCMQSTL